MSKLFSAILFLVVLVSFAFSQQSQPCNAQKDFRIMKEDPTVYLEFERFGKALNPLNQRMVETSKSSKSKEKGEDIWLRLHNNTCWAIQLTAFSAYLPKAKENETMKDRLKRLGTLDDGAEISLFYSVAEKDGKRLFSPFDSFNEASLPSGSSVLFSVSRESLEKERTIYIRFSYDWERRGNFATGEPTHQLSFSSYEIDDDEK